MNKYYDKCGGPEPFLPKKGPLGFGRALELYKCIEPSCLGHLNPRERCIPLPTRCKAMGCPGHKSPFETCHEPIFPIHCSAPGCPGHFRLGEKCFLLKRYCGARGCPGHEPPFTKCFPYEC